MHMFIRQQNHTRSKQLTRDRRSKLAQFEASPAGTTLGFYLSMLECLHVAIKPTWPLFCCIFVL
jgi:hypothetical protein